MSDIEQQLNGYKAASLLLEELLDKARIERSCPNLSKIRNTPSYKEGYYSGLLAAYSLLALGDFPECNADIIKKTLFIEEGELNE